MLSRSWWVILCVLISSLVYFHGLGKKQATYDELHSRYLMLEHEKKEALAEQEELMLQIQSQNDPAWIEMTLKKGLGMVPEGQRKVYFSKD